MNYWLCLTNLENWQDIKSKNVYGFSERHRKKIEQLKKGDKIIIYIISKKLGGVFEVQDLNPEKNIKFKTGEYPHQIKLKPINVLKEPIKIDDKYEKWGILENLKLFNSGKARGGLLIGKSMIKLLKEDFSYINKLFSRLEVNKNVNS